MRYLLSAVLGLHGAIHLIGAAKGFGLAALPQLRRPVTPVAASAWLLATLLLAAGAWLVARDARAWWLPALAGAVVSQALIVTCWPDAKWGTVANVLVAAAVLAVTAR